MGAASEESKVTARQFRKLALSLPDAIESEHMGHPDFRVGGKIFATLNFEETFCVLMLTPEQQNDWLNRAPQRFKPCKGAWGLRGCTQVELTTATAPTLRQALKMAWTNKAPKE